MNRVATFVFALSLAACPACAADAPSGAPAEAAPTLPQRVEVELEPAGVAPGTTVRQARIAQNWLLLGLGSAALAGIIFGLSSSGSDSDTTS